MPNTRSEGQVLAFYDNIATEESKDNEDDSVIEDEVETRDDRRRNLKENLNTVIYTKCTLTKMQY